jgi:histidine phosphotransferase ChpT
MTDTDLSFLIASRICHDLINPIGAIHNGLELMTLSQSTAKGIEFDLVQASANDARARVEFFRLAFGSQKHVYCCSQTLSKNYAPRYLPSHAIK